MKGKKALKKELDVVEFLKQVRMVKAFLRTMPRRESLKSARMHYISSDNSDDEKHEDVKLLAKNVEKSGETVDQELPNYSSQHAKIKPLV